MKKPLKISLISLGSLLGLIIIILAIVFGIVMTPKRATALVNKYAKEFITCDYEIGKVDISLFKTFPDVGVEIENLTLINKVEGCPNDTLAAVGDCVISLNVKELLFNNNIIVNTASLRKGTVNAFFDKDSNNNFDIFVSSDTEEKPEEETDETNDSASYMIDLKSLILNNINLSYTDLASNTEAVCKGFDLNLKRNLNEDNIKGNISLNINNLSANIADDSTSMNGVIEGFEMRSQLDYSSENIAATPSVRLGNTRFEMTGSTAIAADFSDFQLATNCVMRNLDDATLDATSLKINNITMDLNGEKYFDSINIRLESLPTLNVNLSRKESSFGKISLIINDIIINLAGNVAMNDNDINMNLNVETNTLEVGKTMKMVLASILGDALDGISVDGRLKLNADVSGVYNDKTMPSVIADVNFNEGYLNMPKTLPYAVTGINASVKADVNLNDKTDVTISSLSAKMNNSRVSASGMVRDILGKQRCDVNVKADVKSDDIKSFLPDDIKLKAGILADVDVRGRVDDFINMNLDGTQLNATITLNDMTVNCFDTINAASSRLTLNAAFPRRASENLAENFFDCDINGADLTADITDMMSVKLDKFAVSGFLSNILKDSSNPSAICEFAFNHLIFNMDDIDFEGNNSNGSVAMLHSTNKGNTSYAMVFGSDDIAFSMDGLSLATESIALDATADYDETAENALAQWNPKFDIDLSRAVFDSDEFGETVFVPEINMKYNDEGLMIEDSKVVIGNSDFSLKGTLTNLSNHFMNDELLRGEFDFTSDYTDITQLLGLFSGAGSADTVTEQTAVIDPVVVEDDPFIVPLGTDIILHTLINRATFDNIDLRNVGGDFTVKDGNFVLQQVGFTTDAATMMLTAIYKSPRKNHLYVGFDFHLLDIDIAEMINLVPDIDTIVPMLKSFAGKAEFHLAAETNLKSDYSLKYSTLKAACSIEGKDLVVLDSETFNEIKRYLMFDKNTSNKIDSLDVQFTLFRNEIDVYPFLVSLDKYQVALYGRHNLDMSYDYNFSVINPPILNKLGLEVKGPDFDDMHFKLRRGKIKNIYKPEKRNYVEEKILELKKVISESLKENIKDY